MKRYCTLLVLGTALTGCSTTPYYDRHFGEAVQSSFSRQVVNEKGAVGTAATEGQILNSVVDRYHKSYAVPAQPVNVFNIGVGSAN